jgi:hypothetical protein
MNWVLVLKFLLFILCCALGFLGLRMRSLCHQKKGGTQLIKHPGNTPILNRTQTSGVSFFYSQPLISSQSWVLIRIQVVYAHGPSNTQTLHSRNICCSDQEAQSFHLHLQELRRLSAFHPQINLPLTRQHTELGPFRPETHGTQMLDIATDQFPSAKH